MTIFSNYTVNYNFNSGKNNMFSPMSSCCGFLGGFTLGSFFSGMMNFNQPNMMMLNNWTMPNFNMPMMGGFNAGPSIFSGFNFSSFWDNLPSASNSSFNFGGGFNNMFSGINFGNFNFGNFNFGGGCNNIFGDFNFGNFWNNSNISSSKSEDTAAKNDKTTKNENTSTEVTAKSLEEYKQKNKEINEPKIKNLTNVKGKLDRLAYCTPEVVDTIVELDKLAKEKGCTINIISAFRTNAEQKSLNKSNGLYGKGGNSALAGTSPHEFGQAIDMSVFKNGKKQTISRSATPWITDCLARHNMKWGGDFVQVKEPWHFDTGKTKKVRSMLA